MADKIQKGNIYVQKEENNLVVIDPNKVHGDGKTGSPTDRYVSQDELLYFVNLEANPVPRSILDIGGGEGTVRNVVAYGKVNYLGPNGGKPMDTSWTEDFSGKANSKTAIADSKREYYTGNVDYDYHVENKYDTQLLGIKDIQIETKPDNLKTSVITIRMVDVRGRALFDKGPSSIYSTFFHLPYPQFYLTVKGYYGESITYQMVLSGQVKTSFESDGDYYITAKFMATNQKLLNDIRLKDVEVAPYLYEYDRTKVNDAGEISKCKSTRGFDILKQVYGNYAKDKLVDAKLADKPLTMTHLMKIIDRLDTFLEDDLMDEADVSFFSDISDYGKKLTNLNSAVNEWFRKFCNVTNPIPTDGDDDGRYFEFKREYQGGFLKEKNTVNGKDKESTFDIINDKKHNLSLKKILDEYIKTLSEIKYFGKHQKLSLKTNEKGDAKEIEYNSISLSSLNHELFFYNKTNKQMRLDNFLKELEKVFTQYTEEFDLVKDQVEEIISQIQNDYLGFKPTLKNVMGVILANTETFLKVMKYTHDKAYESRFDKDRKKGIENPDNPDSVNDIVYPFPTIYDKNKEGRLEEFYPGDPMVKRKLKSHDTNKWPEIKLVEEYISASTTKGSISAEFCNTSVNVETPKKDGKTKKGIFSKDLTDTEGAFSESSFSELVYRLYNRAIYSSVGTAYSEETIRVLGYEDAKNGEYSINRLLNGKGLFKEGVKTLDQMYGGGYLQKDVQLYETAKSLELTDSTEKFAEERNGFTIMGDDGTTSNFAKADEVLLKEFKTYKEHGMEPYPYINKTWVGNNLKNKNNVFNRKLSTKYSEGLKYTVSDGEMDITKKDLFLSCDMNPLQTPKFVTSESHIARAYWLLNTIPTKSLRDEYKVGDLSENYFARFMGGDVKEISRAQLLKWGSIWYRYTNKIENNSDILDEVWGDLDISQFSGDGQYTDSDGKTRVISYDTATNFSLGFYPELIVKKLNEIIPDEEFRLLDVQSYIASGKLVVKHLGNIVTDIMLTSEVAQSIDLYRCYYIHKDGIIRLPSYVGDIPVGIKSDEIPLFVNRSVSEDWDGKFNHIFNNVDNVLDLPYPNSDMYVFNSDGKLSYNHIEDLVSLFSYETLEQFKNMFLKFTRVITNNVGVSYQYFYHKFLKTKETEISDFFTRDNMKDILDDSQLGLPIKFALDKAVNVKLSVLSSFTNNLIKSPLTFAKFDGQDDNLFNKIIGPVENVSVNNIRKSFFGLADIDASETNMRNFKGIINVWAEWKLSNTGGDIEGFKSFLTPINGKFMDKVNIYIDSIFTHFQSLINNEDNNSSLEKSVSDLSGVEIQKITYRNLKNINDTWIGGFDWDKVNLAKLFKYLNYLNEPIGDKFLMDVRVLKKYFNESNKGKPIASFISMLLKDNSLSEPMAFASSVNFYGNLTNSSENMTDARKLANDVFGVHTTVKKNGFPGFVVFFRSNESEYLNIKKPDFGYKGDSMDITSSEPNPLTDKVPDALQLREGNRGVSFNVDFGIQNQNIFNDFTIQSYDGIKSGEELIVTENIANMKKGTTASSISTNLLDVMKTRVYSCTIKMMGNAMIQPFMYFNLRYIPIYSGTYFILSVQHTLSPDTGMVTTFTGVRISKASVSDIDTGMVKARRNLLDNLIDKLVKKKKTLELTKPNVYGGDTDNQGNTGVINTADVGCKVNTKYWGELPKYDVPNTLTRLTDVRLKELLVLASNELNYTQSVKDSLMTMTFCVSKREQGRGDGVRFFYDNPFGLHLDGNGQSVFKQNVKGYFCPSTSDGYVRSTAVFHDVTTEVIDDGIVNAYKSFMKVMYGRGQTYYNDTKHWEGDNSKNPEYLASLWAFYWNTSYKAIDGGEGKGKLVSSYNDGFVNYTNGSKKDYSNEIDNFTKFRARFNKS